MLFIESSECVRIAESRGAATVQIPVINPVVIKTTKTQPGTSPRSDRLAIRQSFLMRDGTKDFPKISNFCEYMDWVSKNLLITFLSTWRKNRFD